MKFNLKTRVHAFLHPEEAFQNIQTDWGSFAVRAFPVPKHPFGCLNHIRSEVDELEKELKVFTNSTPGFQDTVMRDRVAYEIADVIIVACHLAWKVGIYNLQKYLLEKINKNKTRTWGEPDPVTGVIHHTNKE